MSEEYEENVYGESSSPLHRGAPTDRFVAEWRLRTAHVVRRIAAAGPLIRDSRILSAPLLNPSIDAAGGLLEPGAADLSRTEERVLIEIPTGFDRLLAGHPALALEWRLRTRDIFHVCFAAGYRAVDFFLSRDAGRGHYLLARPH